METEEDNKLSVKKGKEDHEDPREADQKPWMKGRVSRWSEKDLFPCRLWKLLSENSTSVLKWLPNGKGILLDKRNFTEELGKLVGDYLGNDKFVRMRQQLASYGFVGASENKQKYNNPIWAKYNAILKSKKHLYIYEHPYFCKDNPELLKEIRRVYPLSDKGKSSVDRATSLEKKDTAEGDCEKRKYETIGLPMLGVDH